MTDAEFINESLLLENKIIGLKVNMERLRKFFEYALRELCNKNYAEAEKLFRKILASAQSGFPGFPQSLRK